MTPARRAAGKKSYLSSWRPARENTGNSLWIDPMLPAHSARVTAWARIGRHLGMFQDKVAHEHGSSIETGVSKLSDEELVTTVNRLTRLAGASTKGSENGSHE